MPVITTHTDHIKTINNKHSGSSLVMAIFIIIVLSLLGSALVQVLSTSSEAIAQEVLGTRALAAANSGLQGDLQKIFPLTGTGACPALTPPATATEYDFSNITGLYTCKAVVTCDNYIPDLKGIAYYRVTSTGSCGAGALAADSFDKSIVISSRTVQVEARSLP
jgi:MSHA biogenesis protein MshP